MTSIVEEYAPYIALLIIVVGLGGPAVWLLVRDARRGGKKNDNDTKRTNDS